MWNTAFTCLIPKSDGKALGPNQDQICPVVWTKVTPYPVGGIELRQLQVLNLVALVLSLEDPRPTAGDVGTSSIPSSIYQFKEVPGMSSWGWGASPILWYMGWFKEAPDASSKNGESPHIRSFTHLVSCLELAAGDKVTFPTPTTHAR